MIGLLASIKSGVTTLTSRLTSTRAGYLDNLDAAVTTRLGSIKSVQRGTISVTFTGQVRNNATATITSVTTSKSIIELLGIEHASGSDTTKTVGGRVELTNGTTVTAYAYSSGAGASIAVNVAYQVIEFN